MGKSGCYDDPGFYGTVVQRDGRVNGPQAHSPAGAGLPYNPRSMAFGILGGRAVRTKAIIGLAALWLSAPALSQQDFSTVEIRTVPVADGLYMLMGSGGNMAVSVGDDGTLLVDSEYAPLSEKIQAAIRAAGGGKVDFLINTHWHGDHTGGNENFGKAGAIIMAQDNVKARMSTEQVMASLDGSVVPPSPPAALPVLTFPTRMSFHYNGDAINVIYAPNAHTDGDSIVHFTDLNAFHMGDTFFNGGYPFIDVSSGGSIDGYIAAAEAVLSRCNDETRIIPGHGELASPEDLRAFHSLLVQARERIQALIDAGMGEDAVVAARPTAQWDAEWGAGFMDGPTFTRLAYQSLTR